MLSQNEKWLNEAERPGLNPVLVDLDLEYYYKFEESFTIATKTSGNLNEKYLLLHSSDISGDFSTFSQDMLKVFFSCLGPHEFD